MNNRLSLVITAGFVLLIIGGFMKTQDLEWSGFVTSFGTGVLAIGVIQFIYFLIQKRKDQQPN
jgi:1,4-dihydroxy-2-naphthoate octaprenyltransferase